MESDIAKLCSYVEAITPLKLPGSVIRPPASLKVSDETIGPSFSSDEAGLRDAVDDPRQRREAPPGALEPEPEEEPAPVVRDGGEGPLTVRKAAKVRKRWRVEQEQRAATARSDLGADTPGAADHTGAAPPLGGRASERHGADAPVGAYSRSHPTIKQDRRINASGNYVAQPREGTKPRPMPVDK